MCKQIIIFLIMAAATSLSLYSQQISGVAARQIDKKIEVNYNLVGKTGIKDYEIKFYVSTNGGISWEQLYTGITGDVGRGVTAGYNKSIIWDVLATKDKLQGVNIRFKVTATFTENANYTETYAGLNMDMVFIKAGTFMMGSPAGEADSENDEKPQHQVSVNAFYMGKYEVTFEQYDIFCNVTSRSKPGDQGWGRGQRPVINVSWNDATAFCEWLSQQTGKTYRLPTEAEWEYACRAGTTTPFNTGNCLSTSQANYDGNYPYSGCSNGNYEGKTKAVGSYAANAWGLHDMHGNVWEWCGDWFKGYPGSSGVSDYTGSFRVYRGGSWSNYARSCRSADRGINSPGSASGSLGFRVVRVP